MLFAGRISESVTAPAPGQRPQELRMRGQRLVFEDPWRGRGTRPIRQPSSKQKTRSQKKTSALAELECNRMKTKSCGPQTCGRGAAAVFRRERWAVKLTVKVSQAQSKSLFWTLNAQLTKFAFCRRGLGWPAKRFSDIYNKLEFQYDNFDRTISWRQGEPSPQL